MTLACIALPLLGGCSTLAYYAHLAAGEISLLDQRVPLATIINDPTTSPTLRDRLATAERARRFASDHLDLPRNASYTTYVALDRPYVMYNVFATPELSLRPVTHCFLFAGCVAYQGFFSLQRAKALADELKSDGDDVYIAGVAAFSTLGHFADPILSSMNRWNTARLVRTVFHELAHQKIYVKGDTAFNESFASFVGAEGLREWRRANHLPPVDGTRTRHRRTFTGLVLHTRKQLAAVYASNKTPDEQRRLKRQIIATLRARYQRLRQTRWQHVDTYDAWMASPINNAKLLPFGLYDQYRPRFAALFRQCDGQWPAFYEAVDLLADGNAKVRHAFLIDGMMPKTCLSHDAGQD